MAAALPASATAALCFLPKSLECFLTSQSMNLSPAGWPPGMSMPSMLSSSDLFGGAANSIAATAKVPFSRCSSLPTATRETSPAVVNMLVTD